MKECLGKRITTPYRWIAVISITLLMCGCASVRMESVKDPSFSEPCNKLFIIVNHVQLDAVDTGYTQYLLPALKDEFAAKKVETVFRVVSPVALDDNIYLAEIASVKPDGVLTIVSNGGIVGPYGGMAQIGYDISLFDSSKCKRMWRARLYASGGTAVREKRMKMMAEDLVKRLSEEGIIASEPRKTGQSL